MSKMNSTGSSLPGVGFSSRSMAGRVPSSWLVMYASTAAGRGDFLMCEKEEMAGAEIVDGNGGAKFLEIGGEEDRGVGGFALVLDTPSVVCTVRGVSIGRGVVNAWPLA
jgi:hypothetical protein